MLNTPKHFTKASLEVKTPVRAASPPHVRMPELEAQLHFQFQFPNAHFGRQQTIAHIVVSCHL